MIKSLSIFCLLVLLSRFSFSQMTLKLKKEGDIYSVPCKINGIDFDLYFDTGSSLVSLSLKEAKVLVAAGKLNANDIIGKTQMEVATGQFVNGTIILIRELKIGDLLLKDIEAIISDSQSAPLLLGQSAISKFGEFTFDYASETLKIKANKIESIIPILRPEHRNGLNANQIATYEDYFKNKQKIVEGLVIELEKDNEYQSNGENHVSLSFDITNNSDYDFSADKQLFGNPVRLVSIVVTITTKEGKTYAKTERLEDVLSHTTISTSDNYIDINIRTNNIRGIKIRAVDLDF